MALNFNWKPKKIYKQPPNGQQYVTIDDFIKSCRWVYDFSERSRVFSLVLDKTEIGFYNPGTNAFYYDTDCFTGFCAETSKEKPGKAEELISKYFYNTLGCRCFGILVSVVEATLTLPK